MDAGDPDVLAREAADHLRRRGFDDHDVLLVLGSGWSAAADAFDEPARSVPIGDVPGFHAPVAEGHGHEIRSYAVGSGPRRCRVLAFTGRTHLYEGHGVDAVVHATRTAAALGCTHRRLHQRERRLPGGLAPRLVHDPHRPPQPHGPVTATRAPVRRPHRGVLTAPARHRPRSTIPTSSRASTRCCPGPHYETRAEGAMLKTVRRRRGRHVDGPRGHRGARARARGPGAVDGDGHRGARRGHRPERGRADRSTVRSSTRATARDGSSKQQEARHDHRQSGSTSQRSAPDHRRAAGRGSTFAIERNGINVIDESERKGRPRDLFWPWCAANISFLGMSYAAFVLVLRPRPTGRRCSPRWSASILVLPAGRLRLGRRQARLGADDGPVARGVRRARQRPADAGLLPDPRRLGDRPGRALHAGDRDDLRADGLGSGDLTKVIAFLVDRGPDRGGRGPRLRDDHAAAEADHDRHRGAHGRVHPGRRSTRSTGPPSRTCRPAPRRP